MPSLDGSLVRTGPAGAPPPDPAEAGGGARANGTNGGPSFTCPCGAACSVHTKRRGPFRGRLYFKCQKCEFFRWCARPKRW